MDTIEEKIRLLEYDFKTLERQTKIQIESLIARINLMGEDSNNFDKLLIRTTESAINDLKEKIDKLECRMNSTITVKEE